MNITLKFKNINANAMGKVPAVAISINGEDWYQGDVQESLSLDGDVKIGPIDLQIKFVNKQGTDTQIVDGTIVSDMNFELDDISIDHLPLEHLKWQSQYVCDDQQIISGCLFFGPPGYWQFSAYTPILKWMLETNHRINNNDPTWEEDYEYYQKACLILNKS